MTAQAAKQRRNTQTVFDQRRRSLVMLLFSDRMSTTVSTLDEISIPISNASVNPTWSTGHALFAGRDATMQRWLFCLAPVTSAALIYNPLLERESA